MSTLKELIAARKAVEPPVVRCVETNHRPVSTVTFCPWQAKEWTLPWCRLDALSFFDEEEWERVEIFFPQHQVIAVGENLRTILGEIRSFQVSGLRDLPVSQRASLKPTDTFITRLEVRLLVDPKPPRGEDVSGFIEPVRSGEEPTRTVSYPTRYVAPRHSVAPRWSL